MSPHESRISVKQAIGQIRMPNAERNPKSEARSQHPSVGTLGRPGSKAAALGIGSRCPRIWSGRISPEKSGVAIIKNRLRLDQFFQGRAPHRQSIEGGLGNSGRAHGWPGFMNSAILSRACQ
jgi:hypothetical protein